MLAGSWELQRVLISLAESSAQARESHTIRHTTATHLLQAGVDINTIRAWLGHASIETTNIYAEIDLATKAKALATCAIQPGGGGPPIWKDNCDLLLFLRSL